QVVIEEVEGNISVDRVSIRPEDGRCPQEKVVAMGVPCPFTLAPDVKNFKLVLMVDSPASAKEPGATGAPRSQPDPEAGEAISATSTPSVVHPQGVVEVAEVE
ncbi:unnamed protein product, partial [Discosporangium mesarthrocarpum]